MKNARVASHPAGRELVLIRALIRSVRPHQWSKNLFVIAPLLFARHLAEGDKALRSGAAFVAFCFLASGVYLFNDLTDLERDRQHPTKRFRPIASGDLPVWAAWVAMA